MVLVGGAGGAWKLGVGVVLGCLGLVAAVEEGATARMDRETGAGDMEFTYTVTGQPQGHTTPSILSSSGHP